ncbi:MAG: YggS family pyridoxal phosphate-dependent enzyme [Firmicutes bacterium HGW-Firmicutes-12]|nr:MAG: YggS family pyridoxal phosphate-dependent enzyme [Firmicutes bacterium HGW-Firmicutes-12]
MDRIRANMNEVKEEIAEACRRSERNIDEIKVIAVSKSHPVEVIRKAIQQGLDVFGENRVQELIQKQMELSDEIEWHLIGTLQRNKIKYIIGQVALIHSVDSYKLAQAISSEALARNIVVDVLLQVNIAGEISKSGFDSKELLTEIKEISTLKGIKIKGLMTIAPYVSDIEEARPVFKQLRLLAKTIEDMKIEGVEMKELSMGMSSDFTVAVEEGATLIRVGSRIFGRRN